MPALWEVLLYTQPAPFRNLFSAGHTYANTLYSAPRRRRGGIAILLSSARAVPIHLIRRFYFLIALSQGDRPLLSARNQRSSVPKWLPKKGGWEFRVPFVPQD